MMTPSRHALARQCPERGASSVEAALVLPVLLVIFFGIVQGAITLHAGNIAQASAQSALETARLYDGSTANAMAAGLATASDAGDALTDVEVTVELEGTLVEVTVTGTASSIVPGMPVIIERTVSGPREHWVG